MACKWRDRADFPASGRRSRQFNTWVRLSGRIRIARTPSKSGHGSGHRTIPARLTLEIHAICDATGNPEKLAITQTESISGKDRPAASLRRVGLRRGQVDRPVDTTRRYLGHFLKKQQNNTTKTDFILSYCPLCVNKKDLPYARHEDDRV